MSILYALSSIGSLVCFIMVLIQLFKTKGALHGILGIICGLYTFIWGWIHAKDMNLSKIMLIWTICMGVSMVSGMMFMPSMAKQIQEQAQQEAAQKAQPK